MRQWKIAAALLAFLLLPTLALADDLTPQKITDIQKFLRVSPIGAELQETISSAEATAPDIAAQQGIKLTPETQRIAKHVMRKIYWEKLCGPGSVLEQMVPVIADTFTDEEIRQYIQFYQTPMGKKLATATPALSKRMSDMLPKLLMPAMQEFSEQLTKALADKERLKPQHQAPAAGQI